MSEELRAQARQLAEKIPCQLCQIKGGHNIESDGGCRHRGILTGEEVSERISRLMAGVRFSHLRK